MDDLKTSNWSQIQLDREASFEQGTTLDLFIEEDNLIRAYDLLLKEFDWSEWEDTYKFKKGQPPIKPFYIAGLLLYGISERIRSSRDLEKATRMRLDFMWFLEGQTIDHSTICKFRIKFESQLKDLSKQIKIIAQDLLGGGKSYSTDGTRIRSNSSRHGARTAKSIEKKLAELDKNLATNLEKMAIQDTLESPQKATIEDLNNATNKINKQKKVLEKAKKVAMERDIVKQKKDGKKAKGVRVPVTDPDSSITKNKDGGYAPNYTPTTVIDNDTGIIMQSDIPVGSNEAITVPNAVIEIQDILGIKPKELLFDGGFKAGTNLEFLDKNGIQAVAPIFNTENNPAIRDDARIAVLESDYEQLPLYGKSLDKSAFIYDKEDELYLCPMGEEMLLSKTATKKVNGKDVKIQYYTAQNCADCPLAKQCLVKAKNRTITRDEYECYRDKLAEHMKNGGNKTYKKRAPNSEGGFAHIKGNLYIRQFLLRSLNKVRIEWEWICSACNFRKIARYLTI